MAGLRNASKTQDGSNKEDNEGDQAEKAKA